MPTTPQERVRASIVLTVAGEVAQRLLQSVKANPAYKLADLRTEDERAIFIEAAMAFLLDPKIREDAATKLNQLRSHGHALEDGEAVAWQARQDVVRYSDVPRFGVVNSKGCYACHEPVITNRVTLIITENIHAEGHGLCFAKDEARFEMINEDGPVYRVRPVKGVDVDARD